jgi:hypothetical protein
MSVNPELVAMDTDGVQRFIWMQRRNDTCGPACVYMIERILRQQSIVGGESRVRRITELLPNGYTEGNGTASYRALAQVLERLGIPAHASFTNDVANFAANAAYPYIARVGWSNGGGHFVVCVAETSSSTIVCQDPWYGLVEPPRSNLPAYRVTRDYRAQLSPSEPINGTLSGHMVVLSSFRL